MKGWKDLKFQKRKKTKQLKRKFLLSFGCSLSIHALRHKVIKITVRGVPPALPRASFLSGA